MPYRKKSTSPDYYWIFFLDELIDLAAEYGDPSEVSWWYERLLGRWTPPRCVDLNTFCEAEYWDPGPLYVSDFLDGSWLEKLRQVVYSYVWFKHAEEY